MAGERKTMAEDYYPGGDGGGDEPMQSKGANMQDEKPAENEAESQSCLVPKAMFGKEVSPGDTCTFRVVRCYEDECELQYVGEEKSESDMMDKPEMGESMKSMESMAS